MRQRILQPLRLRSTWLGPSGVPAARLATASIGKDTLAGDTWMFVYFTNGSAHNVWSRTLVDSTMA
ncbi:hypothetical protein KRR26_22270 [Corallococcus sp. M34]|uniref:hypothetical protein n=1 Tax=Citreicoccus inhibens TaxID=2849499 RepID=UPI001C250A1B|nr:hypothetical protein [Citreicoccus inhibens]MBU8898341.1 hypothetical protein [Citreicoccus inhibens]